ncbi:MAG: CDGSH iron-sulfur domain-containing protein [Cyanobacteriota bacterium]
MANAQHPKPMAANHPQAAGGADQVLGPEPLTLPPGVHHLCTCGRSRHGWWCDGAHLGTGRIAFELQLDKEETVWLCRCGRSRRHPFCDGRHSMGETGPGSVRPWWRRWF